MCAFKCGRGPTCQEVSFLQSSIFSGSKNFPEIQEKQKKSRLRKSKQYIQQFVEEGSNSRLQTDIQVCFHRRRCWWFDKGPMRRLTRVRPTHETPRQLIILQHLQKAQVKNKNSTQDTGARPPKKLDGAAVHPVNISAALFADGC